MSEQSASQLLASASAQGPGRAEPLLRFADNPILIGQARRRLRRRQVLPALLVPTLLGLCGVLLATQTRTDRQQAWAMLSYASVIYMGLVLFLRGTMQVAGTLGEERRSGILDFHRATPTTPWTDGLGYLLGAAAREYLVAAVGLPFFLLGVVLSGPRMSLPNAVLFLSVMLLSTWLYHAVAMVVGLSINSKRGVSGVAIVVVLMTLWAAVPLYKAGFVTLAYLTPFPAAFRLLHMDDPTLGQSVSFFGLVLHPLLFTLLVQGSMLGFLFLGAKRKLRREGATTFSRMGASAFFGLVVFLCFGGAWSWITGAGKTAEELSAAGGMMLLVPCYLFAAVALSSGLLIGLSPSYLEYVRALRRARRRGVPEATWLDDGGAAWPLAALFSMLVFLGLAALAAGLGGRVPLSALLSPKTAVCVLACVSFLSLVSGATEYTKLSQRRSARSWGMLIVFVLMALPWMLSGIAKSGGADGDTVLFIGALSPTFGLGASTLTMAATWAQEAADKVPTGAVGLSIVLTMAVAGWFLYRIRALQARLAETMPLGSAPRT